MLQEGLTLKIEKLNEKGYGVSQINGREFYILNGLPGEEVEAEILNKKRGVVYALATNILKRSKFRVESKDEAYLSTSPWQILSYDKQLIEKKTLIKSFYNQADSFHLPDFEIEGSKNIYGYRNKMEYAFYLDDEGISLAFHKRDSKRGKIKVEGSSLASPNMNKATKLMVKLLNSSSVKFSSLKSLVVRSSFVDERVVLLIFVKDRNLEEIGLNEKFLKNLLKEKSVKGISLIYSDPKSPASIITDKIIELGEKDLEEEIGGMKLKYSGDGFFQINPEMFSKVIEDIKTLVHELSVSSENLLDIYAGVGSIGLNLANYFAKVTGVELHPDSKKYALQNAKINNINNYDFYQGSAEDILDLNNLKRYQFIIVDPPRSGVHPKLMRKIVESGPEFVLYMSCNPKTQAADLVQLKGRYQLKQFKAYDFYPNTPHIESVALLSKLA